MGGPEMAPQTPPRSSRPGKSRGAPRSASQVIGAPRWPPNHHGLTPTLQNEMRYCRHAAVRFMLADGRTYQEPLVTTTHSARIGASVGLFRPCSGVVTVSASNPQPRRRPIKAVISEHTPPPSERPGEAVPLL